MPTVCGDSFCFERGPVASGLLVCDLPTSWTLPRGWTRFSAANTTSCRAHLVFPTLSALDLGRRTGWRFPMTIRSSTAQVEHDCEPHES